MEKRDYYGDLPWSFSSRNPPLYSPSSSSTPAVNYRRANLYSEYHPVGNTAPPFTQNLPNFHANMSGNRRETLPPIPVYLPENTDFIYPSDLPPPPSPENQYSNFFMPEDNLSYHNPYHRHCEPLSYIPDHQIALQAAMNELIMDLQRMKIKYAVNGQSFTADPYNIQPHTPHRGGLTNTIIEPNNYHDFHQYRLRNNYSSSSIDSFYRARDRPNYSSLEEIKGRMATVAMEKAGCSFLQRKIRIASRDEFEAIFSEIIECVREVMMDQFGHHLIVDLYQRCNEEDITRIVLALSDEEKLLNICLDVHGTHVIQILLEHYLKTQDQISIIFSVLRPITIILSKCENGKHVINKCFTHFSFEYAKYMANEIANNCVELALDKSGCCVLQGCITNAKGESRERIINDITANALILSENPYGNYVVKFLMEMKEPRVSARIIAELEGRFVSLSMNKYGSNVVEQCFIECPPEQFTGVVLELLFSPNFVAVMQDEFGNYVVQKALEKTNEPLRNTLVNVIQSHIPSLHSHPYGKRVLAKIKDTKHHLTKETKHHHWRRRR